MFDIGFPELLLVSVVMLLVFGPERLPEVLRNIGRFVGGARRSFDALRTELEREVGADELLEEVGGHRRDVLVAEPHVGAHEQRVARLHGLDAELPGLGVGNRTLADDLLAQRHRTLGGRNLRRRGQRRRVHDHPLK